MAKVSFENVSKVFRPSVNALTDFSLTVPDKEFLVLIGPSGSGKSTVLRLLAGLEEVTAGNIFIDELDQKNIPAGKRKVAMVFQTYTLFPHMTVEENIAFGLKQNPVRPDKITARSLVFEAAKTLELVPLLGRKPNALSGGEKQRTALARAMVSCPRVFLLDEPLSNLDPFLRLKARALILKLHKTMQTTFIYVTHDQTEAMTMADRIVVMNKGKIQQIDTPKEIYNNPKNLFVASFIGAQPLNLFDSLLTKKKEGILVTSPLFNFYLPNEFNEKIPHHYFDKENEKAVKLALRTNEISLEFNNTSNHIVLNATINFIEELGTESIIHTLVKDIPIAFKSAPNHNKKPGQTVTIALDKKYFKYFDANSEENLFF